jgi:hypothetical protein
MDIVRIYTNNQGGFEGIWGGFLDISRLLVGLLLRGQ